MFFFANKYMIFINTPFDNVEIYNKWKAFYYIYIL